MIVSASRRTDIPAFYADWFINRVRAGFCVVPNPFNPRQLSRVSLACKDVDCMVFWTRNPTPLARHLDELDERGFHYYFQFTVMNNPRVLDPRAPPVVEAIDVFRALAGRLGPGRVIWRYDPIVLSNLTPAAFHSEAFAFIAKKLAGCTRRAVISFVDCYKTVSMRMRRLEAFGLKLESADGEALAALVPSLVRIAASCGMELVSCAETIDLRPFGVQPGACVDGKLVAGQFGRAVSRGKDPCQRQACGCAISKDIGMYDTCPMNCVYCYATRSVSAVERNRARHDPQASSLIPLERTD